MPRFLFTVLAACAGLLVGLRDCAATGDDGPMLTLTLLVLGGVVTGWARPLRFAQAALWLGAGLPAVHLAAHALGFNDHVQPDTTLARLLLAPIALITALLGAAVGAAAWRAWRPPSPQ